MLNFNSNNKSWKMYTNTITSIANDDLLIKPNNTNDLILEVSANNHIIIKKGDISYSINTKITSIDTSFSNVYTTFTAITSSFDNINTKFLLIDASFNNKLASISGNIVPLNDICYNLGSDTKAWANAYIRDISVTNISTSGNILPLLNLSGSLGISTRIWANAFIKDISGLITINGLPYVSGSGTGTIDLTNVTSNINPSIHNSGSLGISGRSWRNALIRDISVSSIDVSVNINPLITNRGSLGVSNRIWGNAFLDKLSATSIDVSVNINPLIDNNGSLGSNLKPWSNAYIRDLSVTNILDVSSLRIENIVFGGFISTNYQNTITDPIIKVGIVQPCLFTTVESFGLQVINTTTGTDKWSAINIEARSVTGSVNKAGIQFTNVSTGGTFSNTWNIHCRDNDTSLIFTKVNNFHTQTGGTATAFIRNTGVYVASSDDRLKHNEIIINNGLTIIKQLVPKFYQKTQVMLDTHYYGDLSGYEWSYEAGLIAQEVLQINDISFAVSGGDYYDSSNNLIPGMYSLGYNHIFVYGLAAIKELHEKVKTQELNILNLETNILSQETTLFNQQTIINSLIARIEVLENKV